MYFEESLHLSRKHSDLLGEAECLETIGDVMVDSRHYEDALRFFTPASPRQPGGCGGSGGRQPPGLRGPECR